MCDSLPDSLHIELDADIQGTGTGLIRSSAAMLGASGPVVFGVIAERDYFNEGYLLLAILMGLITLHALRIPRA